ncbi:4-(cytidine 5'-diphospho)-2-C-methyl-D-erythritol kinase [Roseivirga sp. BDSF3-8]|uniref:4-(cytidine 5'-diphospho)-2-C-methyl-D-erythritol kinase n=1 Tax=Roseivirga sp. BDSF3-8 TaxID=3241598 RepID=UPI00353235C1
MIIFPNAKVNLGLNIIKRRKDGFHEIETCFLPVPWREALEIVPAPPGKKTSLTITGLEVPGQEGQNLIMRAFKALHKDFQLPASQIYLHKALPMGAGLGGGSADAAFALSCLNELYDLYLSDDIIELYAQDLGSDCPFFLYNRPMMARGRGEVLSPIDLDLSSWYMVIVHPGIHIGTREAYSGVAPGEPEGDLEAMLQTPVASWKDKVVNQFETSVFPKYPEIEAIRDKMYEHGAVYSSMTGSGSAVYGLFSEQTDIRAQFSDSYTVWQGQL